MTAARLRVLQVGKFYHPYRGGMETHLKILAERLSADVDVQVVVANTGRKRVDEVIDGVAVTRMGTAVNLGAAPYTPGLADFIRRERPDVVHLHLPHPTAVLAYLASGHSGRLIVTYHSDIVRQRVLGWAFRPFLHACLRRASAIICTSPNYIDTSPVLREHRDRCHVVPFSIASADLATAPDTAVAEVRAKFGPRIVLAVGRLVGYKGFEHLIRAMADIDAHLVLIGRGPLRESLERLASTCRVSERCTLLPGVDELAPYLHAADVFVLPSIARSEAFGLVQLEAMAAGVPVVNTSIPSGVPYVSVHDSTGFTVPPANPSALAEAVNRLLADPQLRARFGAAGRERVRARFDVDVMVRETLGLYDAAMKACPHEPIENLRAV